MNCTRTFDSDLLGLGVRIGTYCQLFATGQQMSATGDLISIFNQTMVFLLGQLVAISWQFYDKTVTNYNAIPFIQLGFSLTFVAAVAITLKPSTLRHLIFNAMTLCVNGLQLWYWSTGYKRAVNVDCGTVYLFFFVKVEAFGWVRIVAIVSCVLGVLGSLRGVAASLAGIVCAPTKKEQKSTAKLSEDEKAVVAAVASIYGCIISFVSPAFLIAAVEMTLKYNGLRSNASELKQVGQMISLVVGIGSVVQAVSAVFREDKDKDKKSSNV